MVLAPVIGAGMQAALFASQRYDWFEIGVRAQLLWLMSEYDRQGPVTTCIAQTEDQCGPPFEPTRTAAHPVAAQNVLDDEILQTSVQPWLGFHFDPAFFTLRASLPLDEPLGFGTNDGPYLGFWLSGGLAL